MEEDNASFHPSSATQSSNPGTESSLENTWARVELFRKLLEEVENGRLDPTSLSLRLQEAGASPDEAKDYLEQLQGNIRDHHRDQTHEDRPNEPGNQDEPAISPQQSADAVLWAQFRRKLGDITGNPESSSSGPSIGLGDLAKILDFARPRSTVIPPDVLAEAPHLEEYLRTTQAESHLEKTWKLRQTYATEKATDAIVDLMQQQTMPDPLPRSIWKDIILDKYVDFEKLYAGMDRGYDHDDEPKDFGGGYSIVKKDHFRARKPVQTESEWTRIAQSWKQGVELLYPHRKSELVTYMEIIEELFRAAPRTPSVAICVDVEALDRYAKHPYRMDDHNQLHSSILAQMFRASPTTPLNTGKRRGSPPLSSNKKSRTVCRNWNLGFCNDDECPYQRTHVCYECGNTHRAKDRDECLGKLKKKRRTSGPSKSSNDNQWVEGDSIISKEERSETTACPSACFSTTPPAASMAWKVGLKGKAHKTLS
jgi:hypothetical protein